MIGYYGLCSGVHIYGYDLSDQPRVNAALAGAAWQGSSGGYSGPCGKNNAYDNYRMYVNGIASAHNYYAWSSRQIPYDVNMRPATSSPTLATVTQPVATQPQATVNPTIAQPSIAETVPTPLTRVSTSTSGCGTCSTVRPQATSRDVAGVVTRDVAPQQPLAVIGPLSIPQTGMVKICWPCAVFWLMVAYLAVSKRRRG